MITASFLALVPFILGAHAANDWSVPCTSGSCSWDLPAGTASGTMKIWGSNTAISDITNAANWQILGCNSTAVEQNIRLVCMDDSSSQCSHLYENTGAVNKIIRLPADCGANPFARVAQWGTSDNQTIPASIQKRLVRRAGTPPVVYALSMDSNFDAVDHSKNGAVNIAFQGANVAGAPTTINIPGSGSSRRRGARLPTRRGLGSLVSGALSSVKSGIDNAASSVKNAAENAGSAVTSVAVAAATKVADEATKAESAAKGAATKAESVAKGAATKAESAAKGAATKAESAAKGAATKVESAAKSAATKVASAAKAGASAIASATNNTVDVNHTFALKPITFDKSKNLISKSVDCGPVGGTLSADIDADANAQVTVSVAAEGTIVPPKLTSFGVVVGMTGSASGTVTMNADVTGQLDSGLIPIVNIGIPGFDIPGIFTVGPSFQVNAELSGDVDVTMDMTLGVNLDINNAQLAFPPSAADPTANNSFSLGDTPVTLSAAPNVDATGTITAHLIPSVNLGISALGKKADATISLSLDTNAALTLNLDGSASATKVVEPNSKADDAGSSPVDVTKSVGGCFNVDGGVDVTASADADFFGLFDKGVSASLFSKNFQIFQKCFGDQADGSTDSATEDDDSTEDDSTEDDSTTDDSTADDSTTDDSTTDDSTTDDSTADDSTTDDSTTDDSTTDDSTTDASTADDSTADDSTADDSTADDSTADDSTADDSTADDSTADDSTADDSTADDSTADDSTTDDSTADDSATDDSGDDSATDDSTTDDSASDDSTTDDSASDDSTTDDSTSADDSSMTTKRFSRRRAPRLSRSERQRRAGFTCPASGSESPVPVATETVKASSITSTDSETTAKAAKTPAPTAKAAKAPAPATKSKSKKA